ncbi:helix-turn-helix transcriptional regulator [Nocardia sp. NPDC023988]|uniref:helix-turn-helix transcriptional regulator n=1 Tax=unclassified Nocardia TaxID=2637762 RepID=UPI003411490E
MNLTQARRRLLLDLIGIRKRRGYSQAQVAEAIGINRSGICRFEADIATSNPTMDVVLRYAHAVGAAVDIEVRMLEDAPSPPISRSEVTLFVTTHTLPAAATVPTPVAEQLTASGKSAVVGRVKRQVRTW